MQVDSPLTKAARRILSRFVMLMFVFLTGCARDSGDAQRKTIPPELAEIVSAITSGTVASGDAIVVRFVEPVIEPGLVGHALKEQVFTFAPHISGITSWETTRELSFRPNRPMKRRQSYQAELKLAALRPAFARLEPLRFTFDVAGREIRSLEGDFELRVDNDPRYLIYRGRLVLTEHADLQTVIDAATLRYGNTRLSMTWQADASGRDFTFASSVIERDEKSKDFTLIVDDALLELSEPYRKYITLAPLQDMAVVEVKRDEEGARRRLILVFSDELDVRHPIEGLVQMQPQMQVRLTVSGKQIFVDGDFIHGWSYYVALHPGIRSRWGTRTKKVIHEKVSFADRKPQLRFARDGVFLASSRKKRLRFATLNLKRAFVEVKKVFDSNLGQFLQTERLDSGRERRHSFQDQNVRRVGVRVASDTLEISEKRNIWLEHELDLGALIADNERGLFLVQLSFERPDMLYRPSAYDRRGSYSYGSNPEHYSYIEAHGRVYKPLIISDVGLTYKRSEDLQIVYATHVKDARPLSGVRINLRTYQNQIAASDTTDARGVARFKDVEEGVFYVEAEYRGQRSLIEPGNTAMAWNMSTFDVGGVKSLRGGTRAFVYTERGVYRPGDEINVSVIARHQDNTFPDDHPATCRIFNPRDQLVFEQAQLESREGLYTFVFATRPEDPTGNWRARLRIGDSTFDHVLKVETVVPSRIKTKITPVKERLVPEDEFLIADFQSAYLFGSPASELETEISVSLQDAVRKFPQYPSFSFNNALIDYQPVDAVLFKGRLDAEGSVHVEWPLPPLVNVPSALQAVITAEVMEKGGRPNIQRRHLTVDPYDHYVGLRQPEFDYGHSRVGVPIRIPVIVTDVHGNPVAGRDLRYRVYRGITHWWWEYENREAFRRRYKSDRRTELVLEERVVSTHEPIDLLLKPEDEGEYLIEVTDGDEGHTASCLIRAFPWGRSLAGKGSEATLVMKSDRKSYRVGERARIRFPVPKKGSVLFSIEQGRRVLDSRWHFLDGAREEADISFPVTAEMVPTAYASVSLIQPHGQADNDRPIRLFGTLPIPVFDVDTHLDFDVDLPETLRPGERFEVRVKSSIADSVEFTIAIVDEGLLSLTDFPTPDPRGFFFQKQSLQVRTFDLFSHVIGVPKGDPFKTFSIGGGFAAEEPVPYGKRRRFPPVSMFAGPLSTDASGHARVAFTMPNYVGAVRTMVVGARGKSFGHAERTTEVKNDLMVVSSLPRVIGPGDRIQVPATAYALADSIGRVDVSINVWGPLTILGEARHGVDFSGGGERDVVFEIQADDAVGPATIVVEAVAAGARATRETHLEVRPSSAPLYESREQEIVPGGSVSFAVPDRGLPGTNRAWISVRRRPDFNFENQMHRLVRYPYGCVEQTVSAVFPQLYLKDLVDLPLEKRKAVAAEIDERINAAINRLRRFSLPDGSFSLWPGHRYTSVWGSVYAGHFLIEARKLGYHVPEDLYESWLRYQQSQSASTGDPLKVRAYRVYLLALAGNPAHSAMNLLKENDLLNMENSDRWLLATAYLHAGTQRTAREIAGSTGLTVEEYSEFAGTYGSDLRDRALILENLVALKRWSMADSLAKDVARAVKADWHSTQTTGVALLALGKYVIALQQGNGTPASLTGHVRLPEGGTAPFDFEGLGFRWELASGFGEEVQVHLKATNTVSRAFVSLDWEGVPLQDSGQDEAQHIGLSVDWLDEDGTRIDPGSLAQGATFWGHFRVENESGEGRLDEVALTQLLPAGWEIDNTRLATEARPEWMDQWRLNVEDYLDVRDDRVNWFFDLPRRGVPLDFVVKLNAVTRGSFTLPPTHVEAMYNRDFRARRAGGAVVVTHR